MHDSYCFIQVRFCPETIYLFSIHFILNELSPSHFLTFEIFVKISSPESLATYHSENRKNFRLSQNSLLFWIHGSYCFIQVRFCPETFYLFSIHFILNELSPSHFLTFEIFVKISSLESLTTYHSENQKNFRSSHNSLLFWIHGSYCFIRVRFCPETIYLFSIHFILNELSPSHFLTFEIFVKISSLESLATYHSENRKNFCLSQNSTKLFWVTRFRETNLTSQSVSSSEI